MRSVFCNNSSGLVSMHAQSECLLWKPILHTYIDSSKIIYNKLISYCYVKSHILIKNKTFIKSIYMMISWLFIALIPHPHICGFRFGNLLFRKSQGRNLIASKIGSLKAHVNVVSIGICQSTSIQTLRKQLKTLTQEKHSKHNRKK